MNRYLHISLEKTKNKPSTVQNNALPCPFCQTASVKATNTVLAEQDSMLLIENKFPTMEKAYQVVFVETNNCEETLANYPKETLYRVLAFGLKQWLELTENPDFSSVLFFKNHGKYSGASIYHAHMQLIGLKDVNYRDMLQPEHVEGIPIYQDETIQWNISTKPRNEFYEFNIKLKKEEVLSSLKEEKTTSFQQFCTLIQWNIQYILEIICNQSQSFNLAFYEMKEEIVVKIIPRNVGNGGHYSAPFLAYGIACVPVNIDQVAEDIKKRYLSFH